MQTVYADLLFLINFSMDLLCLFLVSRLIYRRLSPIRALLAAAAGGVYSVAALFIPARVIPSIVPNLAFGLLICLTAFWKKDDRLKDISVIFFTYLLSSALLGGIMTAVFNLLNKADISLSDEGSHDSTTWLIPFVAAASAVLTYLGGKLIKRRADKQTAEVRALLGGKEIRFVAMGDSGNLLRDCLSGRPVIIADDRHSAQLGFKSPPTIDTLGSVPPRLAKSVALVPCSTVCGNRTIVALRPEKLYITSKSVTREADALIGFASVSCPTEGCSALIPYELI